VTETSDPGGESQRSQRRFGGMTGGLVLGAIIGASLGLIQGDLLEDLSFSLVIGLAIGAGFEGRGQLMQYRPGAIRRVILIAGLFLVLILVSFEFIDDISNTNLKTILLLATAGAFLLFVLALGLSIAGLDELQRRIQTEAIAIGFGFSAVAMLMVGLLSQVGVQLPNWVYAGLPMTIGWGLGKLWLIWKYR
jgi:hypothetical protein